MEEIINGGKLLSESTLNNEQLNKATEETVQRIQGFSEGTTTPGEVIEKAFADIGMVADINKKSLQELAEEYQRLSEIISAVLKELANQITPFQSNPEQPKKENSSYEELLKEYASYEQKRQKIRNEYAKKEGIAGEDKELSERLRKSENEELSKISYDELINSDDYIKLFSQLDDLSVGEMIKLRNNLESEWKRLDLAPEELKKIKTEIDGATKVIREKNPFTALSDAIKGFKDKEREVRFKDILKEAEASFNTVKGSLDTVMSSMIDVGITDKNTRELAGNIFDMVGSAGDAAMGFMSGNISQALQGTAKFISSTMKVLYSGDKKADKEIAEHAKEVKELEGKYSELEKAVDKALGSGKYTAAQDTIKNLQDQQEAIAKQAELERGKKKTDKDKVKEYEKALEGVQDKQTELINKLRNDILGIDAKSAAQGLGNAFIEAFGKGENAVDAFGKKADGIVANIIKNMLIRKLLEEPVGKILDRYSQKWYDDKGNFSGFDSVMKDAGQMGQELKGIGPDFAEAMENLPDDIKKYFVGPEDSSGSGALAGAIKGASEETVNMAAGQLNAMRINQVDANGIIRDQLRHLLRISENTEYLRSIDERIARMESKDSLRAQGLS